MKQMLQDNKIFFAKNKVIMNKVITNKNLAIANRSCVSCAHNMSRASMVTM